MRRVSSEQPPSGPRGPGAPLAPASVRPSSPVRWRTTGTLVALIAVFTAVTAIVSEVRYLTLSSSAWDLGLYQQALWSTAHGHAFYEAPDWETGGFGSFLQVHGAFVLYLLVPLYAALPSPAVLFIVQSVVVGAAVLPLHRIAITVGVSPRRALALSGVYLVWSPIVGGAVHDVHIEAFVPLVFLTTAWLWTDRRYAGGLAAALVGLATMEVVAGLLVALAAYLSWERVHSLRSPTDPAGTPGPLWRALLRDRTIRFAVLLAGVAVAGYLVVLEVRYDLLPSLIGSTPFPPSAPFGYVIGSSPSDLGLSLGYVPVGFAAKASYWALVLSLIAFLPFLAPRSLVLLLPVVVFTFLSWNLNFTTLGLQYGLVVAAPMFLAAAIGLARLESTGSSARKFLWDRPAVRRWGLSRAAVLFGVLVAANLALSPMLPVLAAPAASAGPFGPDGWGPRSSGAFALAGLVPSGASVVASDDLFPLVANDVNAFSLFWHPNPTLSLPFNLTRLPTYALLSENRLDAVPPWLVATLYDPTTFGVRGVAWGTAVGAVVLFERGYAGPESTYGSAPAPPFVIGLRSMTPIAVQLVAPPGGSEILVSLAGATGLLWDGPGFDLAPGRYEIVEQVALSASASGPPGPSAAVLTLAADEFAQPNWFVASFDASVWTGGGSHVFAFNVTVSAPTLDIRLPAYALDPYVGVELQSITVAPTA